MPPKRSKSQTGSAAGQKWEAALLSAPFVEEGKWDASVNFVVENQVEDLRNLEVLGDIVNSGCRKLFSVITKDDLYETVRDLGNPKNQKKGKEIPQFSEICEPCKVFLDSNEEIPPILQAKLLKFKLLDIKTKDLKRRELEKKSASDGPKSAAGKQGKGADKKGADRAKSAGKGKGGKKTPELPSAKNESKLRKRGEEDEEGKYIDDEPDDGPQHYVIIAGFHSPHLFSLLAEIGVTVDSIISLLSEDYARYEPKPSDDESSVEAAQTQPPEVLEAAAKDKQRLEKELRVFWKDVKYLLNATPLHDIARLTAVVEDELITRYASDPEHKEEFGKAIFEKVACMIYDLLDCKRQWKNYLENLNLQHVPVFGEPTAPSQYPDEKSTAIAPTPSQKKAETVAATEDGKSMMAESEVKPPPEVDMRYYKEMMDCVPQESVSVPLVLRCMLQQVVATEEGLEPPSEAPKQRREDGLDEGLAKHISSLAFKLALSEDEQQALAQEFEKPKQTEAPPRTPLLMNHQDEMCERLNHVQPVDGFDPSAAELEMLGYLPIARATEMRRPGEKVQMERAARLQELVHFVATGGLTQAEVDRAFKQFVFECLDVTCTDEEGHVMPLHGKQRDVPWDDPYPYYRGMVPLADECDQEVEEIMQAPPMSSRSDTDEVVTENNTGAVFSVGQGGEEIDLGMEASDLSKRDMAVGTDRSRSPKRKSPKGGAKKSKKNATPHPRAEEVPVVPAAQEEDAGSRSSTPGILRRSDSRSSRKSSVHFERTEAGELLRQPGDEPTSADDMPQPLNVNDPEWSEVNNKQQRNLDQWCFAEHLEPNVFLQVLRRTQCTHPFMDVYYHKRDHSLLLVLNNPMNSQRTNHVHWHTKLHSDVGFRKYLEHIADSIEDWTLEEEAKYQAGQLATEVEGITKEAEAESRPGSAGKGKKGKKDDKKGGAKSPARSRSASRSSSTERLAGEDKNLYTRANSLKAWKDEQDRVKAEEDAKEKEKELKRIKSAEKKREKDAKDKEEKSKKGKGGGSRANSARSKASKEDVADGDEEAKEPERFWPFSGYDMGNSMVEARGRTSSLYPADGGQIRVETVEFEQGNTSVRATVLKDGHTFMVHVLDPKLEGEDQPEVPTPPPTPTPRSSEGESEEKQDTETSEKEAEPEAPKKACVGVFGSFSAQLCDGMNISLSTYGGSGEPTDGAKYAPEPYVPPRPPTPAADGKATPGKGKGKDKGKAATPEPAPAPETEEPDLVSESKVESVGVAEQPFQQMHITCPDGLVLNYYLESSVGIEPESADARKILVKQHYPYKTRGTQECEAARRQACEEVSRVVNTEGTVVKTMHDGTIQILFADGTVSEFVQNSPVLPTGSRGTSLERPGSGGKAPERDTPSPTKKASRQSKRSPRKKEQVEEEPEEAPPTGFWITTTPSGERCCTRLDGSKVKVKRALISLASDPATSQSMQTREDHVVTVAHPDGTTVVEHKDGTRITTFWREISVQLEADTADETGETPDTEVRQVKVVVVECPGFATIKFDTNSLLQCSTEFGSGTVVHVSVDGSYDMYHADGGYLQVDADGAASYFPRPNNELEVHNSSHQLQYNMRHFAPVLMDTIDNEGNQFSVTSTGETDVLLNEPQAPSQHPVIESRDTSRGEMLSPEKAATEQQGEKEGEQKHIETYKQHAPRLFICHPDGSGTELLRYQDVAEYMANAEDDPTTAILMDSLPDYPGVMGITVLRPYNKTLSQKWIKPYIQDTIIPPGLVSRDLTTIPAREEKKPGPKFGTNVGTGLAVGTAVRAMPAPPILKCPNKLEIRQILQYKPISAELRNGLWEGLKCYGDFVRAKLENSELLLLQDPRSPEEQEAASRLADLGAPPPGPEREATMPVEGRVSALDGENIKQVYERATAPPIPSPPPTPQNKRTKADWERDERELAEELENRQKLQKHDVPGYFESELGKAFLLTQAPDMEAMSQMLKEDPRSDNTKAIRSNSSTSRTSSSAPPPVDGHYLTSDRSLSSTPPTGYNQTPVNGRLSENYEAGMTTGTTPSAVRPGNPTPAHAQGNGSPSAVRPMAPTPAHAASKQVPERPGAPTPKQGGTAESASPQSSHKNPYSIQERPQEESATHTSPSEGAQVSPMGHSHSKSLTGAPRLEPVRIPAYLRTGRPLAAPNFRHGMIEDPVRRRVLTSSVAGATPMGAETLARMRGFELLPTHVQFGVLREGTTYSFPVQLKNTGVDACRFKVKQPPPSTGIRVEYKPGPIAAGMRVELNVVIYSIANGVQGGRGVGQVRHKLDIITETDHLYFPITATVLTAYDYDHRQGAECPEGGPAPGVRLVTDKPPVGGSSGLARLRKSTEA